jgi:hypothetical protein
MVNGGGNSVVGIIVGAGDPSRGDERVWQCKSFIGLSSFSSSSHLSSLSLITIIRGSSYFEVENLARPCSNKYTLKGSVEVTSTYRRRSYL